MKLKNTAVEIFWHKGSIFASQGNFAANKVQGSYGARPNEPTVVQTRCKWIIGDVTEVFDRNTWKLGKILKMLKDNYFVVRLSDCIQLKEFHISSLRIPHAPGAPHCNQSPAADKAARDHRAMARSKAVQQAGHRKYELETGGKKRKPAAAADASPHPSNRTQPRSVAMADSYMHSPSQDGDDAECSVASCSVNDPDHHFYHGHGDAGARLAGCRFPDDAMSACPCTSGREDDEEEEPAARADVHGLELEAYRSTMQALFASGPLTWEQESLLTNLRLSLNISNEEHLLQLRRLLSS